MRTIIELQEQQIEALKAISARKGLSRAELVRRAVAEYLQHHQADSDGEAFGLWANRQKDGLTYQESLRREWEA
jgi:metal-responsive CopG/Arc/MetJ family transcriptional regulator